MQHLPLEVKISHRCSGLCAVCSCTVVYLDSCIFLLFLLNLNLRPYLMNFATINLADWATFVQSSGLLSWWPSQWKPSVVHKTLVTFWKRKKDPNLQSGFVLAPYWIYEKMSRILSQYGIMSTQISIFPKLSWWAIVPHCSLFLGNVCLCQQILKTENKIINSWAIQVGWYKFWYFSFFNASNKCIWKFCINVYNEGC